jgi:inorganic pyrophosphatase
MSFRVFIENEAGLKLKNHHDEKALTFQGSELVSRPYPFPYGFIIGTTNGDGDCLDCFVISKRALRTGEILECEAIGLMEQTEDGLSDHNVLAKLVGEGADVTAEVEATLADFVQNVFSHVPGQDDWRRRFCRGGSCEAGD